MTEKASTAITKLCL